MLGASESADHPVARFRLLDRDARIYESTAIEGDARLSGDALEFRAVG
jgi:hypothetical protein